MSCGVGHGRDSDPSWLWLWHRLMAAALMRPLAWEPPCAAEVALEKAKKKKKKKKEYLETAKRVDLAFSPHTQKNGTCEMMDMLLT